MNYSDLLKDSRWKKKRNEILIRDNHSCQRCGIGMENNFNAKSYHFEENFNFKLDFFQINNPNYNLVKILNDGVYEIICKTNVSNSNFDPIKGYTMIVNFGIHKILDYGFNASMEKFNDTNENIDFVEKYQNKSLQNAVYKQVDKNKLIIDLENIWFVEKSQEINFIKSSTPLHVHHKCYRKDKEIWEQHNAEYVTLCNMCHEIIHKTQFIPFYNKYQNVEHFLKACNKCNGLGYIHSYKHIENGICFRCNGNKYFPITSKNQ